ncbi:MAG: GNAT family N-acetyltransferase [Leptolyngbyaceae cyanobacterium]
MIEFYEIKDVTQEDFRAAIQIYIDSFPQNQRLPVDLIIERVKAGTHKILVGLTENNVVSMAILHPLVKTGFVLLEYLAVHKKFRGQGVGVSFIEYIFQAFRHSNEYLIIEVDNPAFGDEKGDKIRRIRFYEKVGAVAIKDVRYLLPPLTGDIPTEMNLMIFPEYNQKIDGNLVRTIIKEIYQQVYSRNENDKFLNSFIHDVGMSVELSK